MKTTFESLVLVGIDVSSTRVGVAARRIKLPPELTRVSNDEDGHSALADGLCALKPELALMEL